MTDNTDWRSDDEQQSLLGRRSYLKVAAGAAALGIGTGTAAAADDFDLIEVSAGDTYTVQLSDGDMLENTLIDITAHGAKYQITAIGSDWEIRNLGVRGAWDSYEKAEPLIASVPDRNGTARIENVYLGDGAPDNTYPGATGIFVSGNHAGVLEIDRVNIQGFPDNAIYGSSPGNMPAHPSGRGGGGEVHITNSYAANCRSGGFRVGTDGSYAKNCVAVGCDRNFWSFYNDTEAIDCDFSGGKLGDIGTGDGQWGANATATVTNTRFESTVTHSGRVVGSSAGSPRRTKPSEVEGVPLTPKEAASGSPSSSLHNKGTEDSDDETRNEDDASGRLLAFVTDPSARNAEYEFTAKGSVELAEADYESPSGRSIGANGNDTIEESNGTYHVTGFTGGGYGDAFRVSGPVTSIDIDQPDVMWVELDGEELSVEEVVDAPADDGDQPSNAIVIDGTSTDDSSSYSFRVTGTVEKATHQNASVDDGDSIDGTVVEGSVDGWKDAYWFSGNIDDFWLDGNANVDVEYDAR